MCAYLKQGFSKTLTVFVVYLKNNSFKIHDKPEECSSSKLYFCIVMDQWIAIYNGLVGHD